MKDKRTWLVVLFIAIMVLIFSWPANKGEKTIRIVDGLSVNSPHVFLASELGYFKDAGLNVEVNYVALGKFAMDALNGGGAEYAGVVEMNIAQTLFTHDDIAILCEYAEPITGIKMLARRDHGIEAASDLVGKKIAVFFGVNIHIFAIKFLEASEIALGDVELVNYKPPDAVAAFINGDVDAIVTWQPLVHRIQQAVGSDTLVLTEDSQAYWPFKLVLATKASYLAENGAEATKILGALLKADKYLKDEPEKAYAMFAPHVNLKAEDVRRYSGEIRYGIRLTPRLAEMIAFEVEWLPLYLPTFYEGKQPVMADFAKLIAPEYLRDLAPQAVEVE